MTAAVFSAGVAPMINTSSPYVAGLPNFDDPALVTEINAMGRTYTDSETPVVFTLQAMVWNDNHQENITVGDLLFASRVKAPGRRVNLVSLPKMNEILRQGYQLFCNAADPNATTFFAQDPDKFSDMRTIEVRRRRANDASSLVEQRQPTDVVPSADQLYFAKSAYSAMISDEDRQRRSRELAADVDQWNAVLKDQWLDDDDPDDYMAKVFFGGGPDADAAQFRHREMLEKLCKNRDSTALYASVQGILERWNLVGIVNNSSNGKGMQTLPAPVVTTLGNAPVFNLVGYKNARVANYWGPVTEMSRLYLILTRRRKPDGTYAEYQFVPWSTETHERPPFDLLQHEDAFSDKLVLGRYIYVGRVRYRSAQESSDMARFMAAGLVTRGGESVPHLQDAYVTRARLEMIDIYFKCP